MHVSRRPEHGPFEWLLLTEAAATSVKLREPQYPRLNQSIWTCARCTLSVDTFFTHAEVHEHLVEV